MDLYDDASDYGDYDGLQDEDDVDDEDLNEEEAFESSEESEEDSDGEDDEDDNETQPTRGRNAEALRQDQEEDDSFNALINTIGENDGDLFDKNALASGHDASIVEDMAAIRDDLALAKGFGGRRRKRNRRQGSPSAGTRRKRERRRSKEMQDLYEAGNLAYASNDLPEAKRNYREIIRLDATESEAWMLLAQVHREQGDEKKEIGCRLVAAHLMHDVETWRDLAERSKAAGQRQQALYCMKRAVAVDPNDVNLLWEHAMMAKEFGEDEAALKAFRRVLQILPHDMNILAELPPLFASCNAIQEGAQLFEAAMEHHIRTFPDGPSAASQQGVGSTTTQNNMGVDFIITLADFKILLLEYEDVINIIRRGQRWLGGRSRELYWDMEVDDREFDPPGTVRRTHRQTGAPELDNAPEGQEQASEGYEMDVNLRHRLAIARLKLGHDYDAKIHRDEVLRAPDYTVLHADIGIALMDRGLYEDAETIFLDLAGEEETADVAHVVNLGICQHALRHYSMAIESFQHVLGHAPNDLDTKMKLAHAYEDLGNPVRALELVNEVREARKQLNIAANQTQPEVEETEDEAFFNETVEDRQARLGRQAQLAGRLGRIERRQLEEEEARVNLITLNVEEQAALAGDFAAKRRYNIVADKMVTGMRQAPVMFPVDRSTKWVALRKGIKGKRPDLRNLDQDVRDMATRLEQEGVDQEEDEAEQVQYVQRVITRFQGIDVDTWLKIIMLHTCFLIQQGDELEAQEILQHVQYATIFQSLKYNLKLQLALLASSMRLQDQPSIMNTARNLARTYQFKMEPWWLLQAALGTGVRGMDSFGNLNLQKFLIREIRMWDYIANGGSTYWNDSMARWIVPHQQRFMIAPRRKGSKAGKSGGATNGDQSKGMEDQTLEGLRLDSDEEDIEPDNELDNENEEGDDDLEDDREGDEGESSNLAQQDTRPREHVRHAPWKKPEDREPAFWLMYGQALLTAKSFQSSIYYFLQSYDENPYDPLVCLCLAQAYLGRSMQRQSDNRLHQITTAMAFMSRYRKLMQTNATYLPPAQIMEEVEYNFGRAFQSLGILPLAVKHYRQTLESISKRMKEQKATGAEASPARGFVLPLSNYQHPAFEQPKIPAIARETAYNLQIIFLMTGAADLCREVTDQWLGL